MADANEIHKKWRSLIVCANDVAWTTVRIPGSDLLALLLHIDAQEAEIKALTEAAHGLSTLAGELAADLDRANGGADDPHLSARFEVTR